MEREEKRLSDTITEDHLALIETLEISELNAFARGGRSGSCKTGCTERTTLLASRDQPASEEIQGLNTNSIYDGITALSQWLASPAPATSLAPDRNGRFGWLPFYCSVGLHVDISSPLGLDSDSAARRYSGDLEFEDVETRLLIQVRLMHALYINTVTTAQAFTPRKPGQHKPCPTFCVAWCVWPESWPMTMNANTDWTS